MADYGRAAKAQLLREYPDVQALLDRKGDRIEP